MKLHTLTYTEGSRNQKEKRVGRGHGSGMGKTSTRGSNGQKSRKSGHVRLGFEGGQTPLYRRVPKVGFNNVNFANEYNVVSLSLIKDFEEKVIDLEVLNTHGLIKNVKLPLKLIGVASLKKGVTFKANKISKGALKSIEDSKAIFEEVK